jgi:hypothetical protein
MFDPYKRNELYNWRASLGGVLAGGVTGVIFGLAGFFLSQNHRTNAMGPVLFLLVPFVVGFAIAMVARDMRSVIAAAILATLGALGLLIAFGREGLLCALMAIPLLFIGLAVGVAFGFLLNKLAAAFRGGSNNTTLTSVILLSMPLLIVAGHRVEQSKLTQPRREVVNSTTRFAIDPGRVWAELQSFDSLSAKKPLLMYVGLPVPMKCVMEGSGVGAKRTCYFDHGFIQETVTEWSPPNFMRLSIDRTNMPGRHWLGFEEASYEVRWDGSATVLARNTIVISNLYPVWYWRPLERWGVSSEHQYIFADIARRLQPASSVH